MRVLSKEEIEHRGITTIAYDYSIVIESAEDFETLQWRFQDGDLGYLFTCSQEVFIESDTDKIEDFRGVLYFKLYDDIGISSFIRILNKTTFPYELGNEGTHIRFYWDDY